ncbi:MAG: hypothetical protein M1519_07210 [Actinobacteria bacterium]|nr:hypothetical protein [Actinomycetota bacterium]
MDAGIFDIHVLGTFRILRNATRVMLASSPRLQSFLGFLAIHPEEPHNRGYLAWLLWPDSSEQQARTNLRKLLHELTHAHHDLTNELLDLEGKEIAIRADRCRIDAISFKTKAEAGTLPELIEAAQLYKGPLLPEVFDNWVFKERDCLQQGYLKVLEGLMALCESRGELREALDYGERLTREDPLKELYWRRLFHIAARVKDGALLKSLWAKCTKILSTELGIPPSPATLEAYERARSLILAKTEVGTRWRSEREGGDGDAYDPNYLKLYESKIFTDALFVGREEELKRFDAFLSNNLDESGESLAPPLDILTVYGTPGIGKSTLLRAFYDSAIGKGMTTILLDARELPNPESLWTAIGKAGEEEGLIWINKEQPLILIDSMEKAPWLPAYLGTTVLPRLTPGAKFVLAGRHPINMYWRDESPWRRRTTSMKVNALKMLEARDYLTLRGVVDKETVEAILTNADRIPLALALGADLVVQLGINELQTTTKWATAVESLLNRLLEDVAAKDLVELLAATFLLRTFDKEMLEFILDKQVSEETFQQFVSLSIVHSTHFGFSLHDEIKSLVSKNLELFSPIPPRYLRIAALRYYRTKMASALPADREQLVIEHLYLSEDAILHTLLFPEETEGVYAETTRPDRIASETIQEMEDIIEHWTINTCGTPRSLAMQEASSKILNHPSTLLIVARDQLGSLLGCASIVPITEDTLEILEAHPAIAPLIKEYKDTSKLRAVEQSSTANVFHLTHVAFKDHAGIPARAVLLRTVLGIFAHEGIYLVSTPAEEYKSLARKLGFRCLTEQRNFAYGINHPCDHFELDLTRTGFDHWIESVLDQECSIAR